MQAEVKALIEHYDLKPLPVEQVLFKSTYRSQREIDRGGPIGTALVGLYCEEPRSVSLFHKLAADEVWHFYGGDPLRLVLLYPDGSAKDVIMGSDPLKGHAVQFVVPAGVWQAGHMLEGGNYSLFGCTMAPGFTNDMFEGGNREQLINDYPDRVNDINALACDPAETQLPKG